MNKKNGFMAISIIFSFFVVFLLLISLNISRYYQNGIFKQQLKNDALLAVDDSFSKKSEVLDFYTTVTSTSADISFKVKNINFEDSISFCYSNTKENLFSKNMSDEVLKRDNCILLDKNNTGNYSFHLNDLSINTNYFSHVRINNIPFSKVMTFKTIDLSSIDGNLDSKAFNNFKVLNINVNRMSLENERYLDATRLRNEKNRYNNMSNYNDLQMPYVHIRSIDFEYSMDASNGAENEIRKIDCQYFLPDGKMSFTGEYLGAYGNKAKGSCRFNFKIFPLLYNKIDKYDVNSTFNDYGTLITTFFDQFGNKYEKIYKNTMLDLKQENLSKKEVPICVSNERNSQLLNYVAPKYSSRIYLNDNISKYTIFVLTRDDNVSYKEQEILNTEFKSISIPLLAYSVDDKGRLSNVILNNDQKNVEGVDRLSNIKTLYFDNFPNSNVTIKLNEIVNDDSCNMYGNNCDNYNYSFNYGNENNGSDTLEDKLIGLKISATISSSEPFKLSDKIFMKVGKYENTNNNQRLENSSYIYKLTGKVQENNNTLYYNGENRRCYNLANYDVLSYYDYNKDNPNYDYNRDNPTLNYTTKVIFEFDKNSYDKNIIKGFNKNYYMNQDSIYTSEFYDYMQNSYRKKSDVKKDFFNRIRNNIEQYEYSNENGNNIQVEKVLTNTTVNLTKES